MKTPPREEALTKKLLLLKERDRIRGDLRTASDSRRKADQKRLLRKPKRRSKGLVIINRHVEKRSEWNGGRKDGKHRGNKEK